MYIKCIVVLAALLLFTSVVYSSDDELQILQGDDEMMFLTFLDLELGHSFGSIAQQSGGGAVNTVDAGGSGTRDRGIVPGSEQQIPNQENEEEIGEQNNEGNFVIPAENALDREALFDISLEVDKKSKEVESGGSLLSVVKLLNLGKPGRVDTTVNYKIFGKDGNVLFEESEFVPVETQKEFLKRFELPDLSVGKYVINADLTYDGQLEPAYSEDTFVIVNKKPTINYKLLFLIFIAVILFILGVYFKRRRFK